MVKPRAFCSGLFRFCLHFRHLNRTITIGISQFLQIFCAVTLGYSFQKGEVTDTATVYKVSLAISFQYLGYTGTTARHFLQSLETSHDAAVKLCKRL